MKDYNKLSQTKTAIVIRHAGNGDAIQASCVLPYLKKDGYEISDIADILGTSQIVAYRHVQKLV